MQRKGELRDMVFYHSIQGVVQAEGEKCIWGFIPIA